MSQPSVTAQVMNLPLCCAWCGAAFPRNVTDHILDCARCGKQTSAHVAYDLREERYARLDRELGWAE